MCMLLLAFGRVISVPLFCGGGCVWGGADLNKLNPTVYIYLLNKYIFILRQYVCTLVPEGSQSRQVPHYEI